MFCKTHHHITMLDGKCCVCEAGADERDELSPGVVFKQITAIEHTRHTQHYDTSCPFCVEEIFEDNLNKDKEE